MERRIKWFVAATVATAILAGSPPGIAGASTKPIPVPMCVAVHTRQTEGHWIVRLRLRNRTSHDNSVRGVWSVDGARTDRVRASAVVPPDDSVTVVRNLGPAAHEPTVDLLRCSDWGSAL
jgi:hypothetical protein